VAFFLGLSALRGQVHWGLWDRLRAVSCRAPEPRPQGQDVEAQGVSLGCSQASGPAMCKARGAEG